MAIKNKPKQPNPKPGLSRFFGKAQGSLEYLLLIGGAVVVTVIVIFVVIGLAGTAGNYTTGQTQQAVSYYKYLISTPEEDLWNIVCFSPSGTNYSLEITSNVVGSPDWVPLSAQTMNALFAATGHSEITVENDVDCKIDAGETVSGGIDTIAVSNGTLQSFLVEGGGISCDGLRFGAGEEVSVTLSDPSGAGFGLIYGQQSAVNPELLLVAREDAPFPTTISLLESVSGSCLLWYGPADVQELAPE